MLSREEEQLAHFVNPADVATHSFTFFEGWEDAHQQLQTRTGKVPFHELSDFLSNSQRYVLPQKSIAGHHFRVISFPRLGPGRLRLFFPKSTYKTIKEIWHLHDLTIEAFLNYDGLLSHFENAHTSCILMKVAAALPIGMDCVSITHNRVEKTTNVLFHSVEGEELLFEMFRSSPERCLYPAYFPSTLYRCYQQRVGAYRNKIDDVIVDIEGLTGLGGPGKLFGRRHHHQQQHGEPSEQIASDSMIAKLSYIQTELAMVSHIGRTCLDLGNWLVDLLERDIQQGTGRAGSASDDMYVRSAVSENARVTLEETEYVKRRATTVLSQTQQLKERAESQTTLIINTAALAQAKSAASIAWESKRDSTAMKAIALLTTLFLPATFVSTFFSMTMFDWSPSNSSGTPKASKYIWVYWAIAIPLTLLVMISLLAWFKWEDLKSARERGNDKKGRGTE